MITDPMTTYSERYKGFLQEVASKLREIVLDHISELSNIDQVTARAKDPTRFAEKASRTNAEGGQKYPDPLTEIQDQIGVRIVVFYKTNVDPVIAIINKYFQAIEEKELVPESFWEFGYFGRHLVLALPRDAVPSDIEIEESPPFFELQVKTLFQHAWSEANHDLGYKAATELSGDQKRRLAFTAAQAWGADRMFQELQEELA
jgi:putative GTP pyrophosphokinase